MREDRIEQQKLRHPIGSEVGGVNLTVPLKCRTALQKTDPLEVFGKLGGGPDVGKHAEMHVQKNGQGAGAFQISAQFDEAPPLVVVDS